jgi:sigma-E factor negative regulatory protein RseA
MDRTTPEDNLTEQRHLMLSALADGEVAPEDAASGYSAWRDEPEARARWHAYHLIGDVLRSGELATPPGRDQAFLSRLRERMSREPAILAPTPAARRLPGPRWLAPAAVAAGFVAVAGVLVVTRMTAPLAEQPRPMLASGAASASGDLRPAGGGSAAVSPAVVVPVDQARLIRDAQVDRYLRAHREMIGAPGVAVPGGALRSVDTIVPQR